MDRTAQARAKDKLRAICGPSSISRRPLACGTLARSLPRGRTGQEVAAAAPPLAGNAASPPRSPLRATTPRPARSEEAMQAATKGEHSCRAACNTIVSGNGVTLNGPCLGEWLTGGQLMTLLLAPGSWVAQNKHCHTHLYAHSHWHYI